MRVDLTPKQLETLRIAHDAGYYETPKGVKLDDLAEHFGVSKAAIHSRLKAAERLVIGDWMETREAAEVFEAAEKQRRARARATLANRGA